MTEQEVKMATNEENLQIQVDTLKQELEKTKPKKTIKPDQLKMIRDLIISARGGDPEAQSRLNELLKIDFVQEKTNFPTAINQQKQTYLKMCEDYFEDPNYPEIAEAFRTHSNWDAITWRGYKGFTTEKHTDMLKKGTDLSGILVSPQTNTQQGQPPKKRFWQRDKQQGEQLE